MIYRPVIHVTGPPAAGKTTFVERLLERGTALSTCVRAVRVAGLRREQPSAPRTHPGAAAPTARRARATSPSTGSRAPTPTPST